MVLPKTSITCRVVNVYAYVHVYVYAYVYMYTYRGTKGVQKKNR
jgi:hypothetical protein